MEKELRRLDELHRDFSKLKPIKKTKKWLSAFLIAMTIFAFNFIALNLLAGDRSFSLSFFSSPYYHILANYDAAKDPVVNEIVNLCNDFKGEDQVQCVENKIRDIYDYNDSNRTNSAEIKTLAEVRNSSGICRDIAVAQDAIFRKLGWETYFKFFPTHVALTIYSTNKFMYCDLDAGSYDCKYS